MIAQLPIYTRWLCALIAAFILSLLAACERQVLPFPTPAQHDLVVLIHNSPLTYATDDNGSVGGLEHDLIDAFAQELGVGVQYVVVAPEEIEQRLEEGEAHFAAAWYSPEPNGVKKVSPPILHSVDLAVQNEAALPVDELADLKGRSVHVMPGSPQARALNALKDSIPGLDIVEYREGNVFDLLEAVGNSRVDIAVVDSALYEIASQFVPSTQPSLAIGEEHPVAWMFGSRPNDELYNRASAFIERVRQDGTLDRLQDRYFGHVRRLRPSDIAKFIERTENVLPKLRKHFQAAQVSTGLDWRLLAAVAYQESQWDPNATSPTGVRGIMMLTEETADRLGVTNRLDPRESIIAGARYIGMLKDMLPRSTPEPDRTWLALSAYNIGPGSFNGGRMLARQLKADPDSWYEMKRILPLLAQPKYYERMKAGRARGGEAVILAENIRSFYDILSRFEPAYRPIPALTDKTLKMARQAKKSGRRSDPIRSAQAGPSTGPRGTLSASAR